VGLWPLSLPQLALVATDLVIIVLGSSTLNEEVRAWERSPEELAREQSVTEPFKMTVPMLALATLLALTFFVPMVVLAPVDLTVLDVVE